ncbi:LEAF RUST 10 DISEASE-RESISTANCE LOCUS RECEPTOR-LIKE PROTEIN KINASE-like 1.1 isoform X2 [Solanum dulcamara]|uniref:LEAF RUST 10 DISEASE-RESISTANCE LOCUS RECEPTOR-LIKE PROTEIN KINASE-like 1.1 isoform X2 n=1 Tax=Solanum dulcamara TaxID=45834 RepID=UPI0024862476|nr:LEAF RUST 10 DISEASE-RESISTANCE LOCUS RECEPTOR-LIKE PROTEIN KINASE-like 1.1 isoform X2 [Solanum dulcamara]
MDLASSFICFLLSLLLILVQAKGSRNDSTCPKSFSCGNFTDLRFPYSLSTQPHCGIMTMYGCDAKPFPKIRLIPEGDWYYALEKHSSSVWIGDMNLKTTLTQHKCQAFNKNFSLPNSPSISFNMININNFFKCISTSNNALNITHKINGYFAGYKMYSGCEGFSIYYNLSRNSDEYIEAHNLPTNCSLIRLPIYSRDGDDDLFNMLGPEILVEWKLSDDCNKCNYGGGQCQTDKTNKFHCHKDAKTPTSRTDQRKETTGRNMVKLILSTGSVIITSIVIYFIWRYKKRKFSSSHFFSTRKLSDIFNHDVEGGSIYFGVPVFSYSELEEATDNFNSSRVLGNGGYGTVYYGKLKDRREIAVKRLYEHNFKRMEQFVNEIDILTRLRHNNLVTLYGCTSRRSRELLLVYEYIPNGTLADHLHGDIAKDGSLTWPIRMNIAVETAGALAYLHSSDVIHCDVKTNNILLDHNFSVKVADFGISRLFPNDVSHISTTPRGTPGYIDPKYHECYQLTCKSDVYSFGVVLVELISSMPAVDMNRQSQEINLANFAINKIIKSAVNELIDPSLGFDSDTKTREMTTSVAELAFLCLQTDRDVRPTMVEVLDTLKEIQTNFNANESEDIFVLKKVKSLPSPNSVTDKWITCSDITITM